MGDNWTVELRVCLALLYVWPFYLSKRREHIFRQCCVHSSRGADMVSFHNMWYRPQQGHHMEVTTTWTENPWLMVHIHNTLSRDWRIPDSLAWLDRFNLAGYINMFDMLELAGGPKLSGSGDTFPLSTGPGSTPQSASQLDRLGRDALLDQLNEPQRLEVLKQLNIFENFRVLKVLALEVMKVLERRALTYTMPKVLHPNPAARNLF